MSISTAAGDDGFTNLLIEGKSGRVSKDDPRIECLGTLDELDAFLALCEIDLQKTGQEDSALSLARIRQTLFDSIMPAAMLPEAAQLPGALPNPGELKEQIEELEKKVSVNGFVRTWNNPAAAQLNLARTVCRRAERRMVSMMKTAPAEESAVKEAAAEALAAPYHFGYAPALAWLNRLSDLLFLLAVLTESPPDVV